MPADQIRDILTEPKVKTFETNRDRVVRGLQDIIDMIAKANEAGKGIEFLLRNSANYSQQKADAQAATAEIKRMQEQVKLLQMTIDQLNKAKQAEHKTAEAADKANKAHIATLREQAKMIREQVKERERLEAKMKREEEAINRNKGAYSVLSKQYNETSKQAQNLGAEIELLKADMNGPAAPGYTAKLSQLETQFKKTSADALNMHKTLLKIDEAVGKSQRNVGNYKSQWSGVNSSIQQLVREVPSVSGNLAMLPLALSNNIGPLIDSLKQAKIANAALAAEGKATIPVWKQVGSAIFSWQTALMAGIALLVAYSSSAKASTSASSMAAKANKDYAESLKSIEDNAYGAAAKEIAHIKALLAVATSTDTANVSTKNRLRAVDELQKTYPDYFGKLSKERILMNDVTDATKEATKAILAKAMAQAYEDKIAAATKKKVELIDAERKAQKELNEETRRTKNLQLRGTANKDEKEDKGLDQFFSQAKVSEAKKNIVDIGKEIEGVDEELNQLGVDLADAAKGAGQLLFAKDPKDPRSPKGTDLTNETIKSENVLTEALADIQKARYELEAQRMEDVFNNEKETLERRLTAYQRYEDDKLAILDTDQQKDLDIIQNALDEITLIEASSADKRTNEQKKLLLQKDGLEAKMTEITERYKYLEEKILTDGNERRRKIAEDGVKLQLQTIMQGAQDIENQVRGSENRKLALLEDYAKLNGWSERKKQEERRKITAQADLDLFNAQQTYFKNYIDELERQGTITKEIAAKIMEELAKVRPSGAKSDRQGGILSEFMKSIFGDIEDGEADRLVAAYSKAAQEIVASIQAISDAVAQKKIDQHQAEIDRINEEYDLRLLGLKTTAKTEEEYNKQALQLKANAFLATKQQEAEISRIKRRQAAADKVAAIGDIIANTGVAILSALASKAPAPVKAALAIAYGLAGAAQIARVAATPLPQYAKGTKSKPESGPAIVGEKGAELFREPGKDWSITPSTATVMDLAKGTEILTADRTKDIVSSAMLSKGSGKSQEKHVADMITAQVMDRVGKGIIKAIKEQKPVIFEGVDPWRAENMRYKTQR